MEQIKALCLEFNNARNELRLSVAAANVPALREALAAAGYCIALICEDFKPGVFCVRAV